MSEASDSQSPPAVFQSYYPPPNVTNVNLSPRTYSFERRLQGLSFSFNPRSS
jgi:hypothetical protein